MSEYCKYMLHSPSLRKSDKLLNLSITRPDNSSVIYDVIDVIFLIVALTKFTALFCPLLAQLPIYIRLLYSKLFCW